MKRMIGVLLILLCVCGTVCAEEAGVAECQHEYALCTEILLEHQWSTRNAMEGAFLASAVCTLCEDACLIINDKSLVVPEPCEPDVCHHRLYTLPAFHRTIWRPAANEEGEFFHERVEYDVGVCLDCGLVATVYATKETGEHRMEEKSGFHIEGQYIHVTCQECDLCGLMTGALVPCISYEDGSCDRLEAQ